MKNHAGYFTWGLAAVLLLVMAACSSGGNNGNAGSSGSQTGTLSVSLTDAPSCGFDAVNVTVSKVRIHQSSSASENDAGWSEITLDPARKIDLLGLVNGATESLGETPLIAGHYTQLRLVLSENTGTAISNSVVLSGTTTEIAIDTPSSTKSGIKLINEFDVAAGQRVDLVLDFDACKSVVTRGNGSYLLKPVIKVVPTVLNGIDGYVDASLLNRNVLVSAQSGGTVIVSTVPDPHTGEFFLARLDPGSYDVVITADSHATAVIAGVPITATTSVVSVSTVTVPVSLPTATFRTISGTVTLNPASSDAVAYVAATQTFGTGPVVTVKSQAADLLTGSYSLNLPADSPIFGQYGSGVLPIKLTSQASVAGMYTVEATASGYQAESAGANISAGDAAMDFTLTP